MGGVLTGQGVRGCGSPWESWDEISVPLAPFRAGVGLAGAARINWEWGSTACPGIAVLFRKAAAVPRLHVVYVRVAALTRVDVGLCSEGLFIEIDVASRDSAPLHSLPAAHADVRQ